jgi:enoyl-CoA hydratase/carnithine racemase
MGEADPPKGAPAVLFSKDGGVALITLNRPERLNAINAALIDDLHAALLESLNDDAVRAIVLTGAGDRAFCSGDDLADAANGHPPDQIQKQAHKLQDISRLIMFGAKPVIAAVNGWAVGGGFEWVTNCDFIVWDEKARAFCPEASLGLTVTGGVTVLLAKMIGAGNATALLDHGIKVDAAQLNDWGLVDIVAPEKAALGQAMMTAAEVTGGHRTVAKRAASLAPRATIDAALDAEAEALIEAFAAPDISERLAAFGEQP